MSGGGTDSEPCLGSVTKMVAEASVDAWLPVRTRFCLMGTVHGDPRGFQRLRHFLQRFQPDLILLEMSPFAWTYRKTHRRALHQTLTENIRQAAILKGWTRQRALVHPQMQAIRRQIAMPFEFRAGHQYARAHNKWLLLIDRSDFSVHFLARWPDLLSATNLALLLTLPESSEPQTAIGQYHKARRLLYPAPSRIPSVPDLAADGGAENLWLDREYSLAERIRSAVAAIVPGRCVYVGGWEHLKDQAKPPSLRCLLGVTSGQCLLLDDFDP
jgi:hypothetical protein